MVSGGAKILYSSPKVTKVTKVFSPVKLQIKNKHDFFGDLK